MMDEFEKYIQDNRSAFDQERPDKAKIWADIAARLDAPESKTIPLWRSAKWRVAAGILIVLGLFTVIGLAIGPWGSFEGTATVVNKELQDIDSYYRNLVSYQVKLVQEHPKLSKEEKAEFLEFMDELDAEYETLRVEMQKNLDNERILEAIVSNYKKRIELIENLLRQINESKKPNDEDVYIL